MDGASRKAPPSLQDWKASSSQVGRKERRARDVWRCVTTRNQPSVWAFFFFNLFLGLHWVFIDSRGLSLVAAIKSYSLAAVHRLLIAVVSLVLRHTTRETLCRNVPTAGTGLQQLWCTDLVAPPYLESPRTKGWVRILCTGRWILIHWTTRKVLLMPLNICFFLFPKQNWRANGRAIDVFFLITK